MIVSDRIGCDTKEEKKVIYSECHGRVRICTYINKLMHPRYARDRIPSKVIYVKISVINTFSSIIIFLIKN
jgi:hypothetical protein